MHNHTTTFIPKYGNPQDPNIRKKYGYFAANISILGNILLFTLKIILGIYINSIALIADAIHTLSDIGTSGIVLFGFKLSSKPKDKEHPFGHGRIEYIATLILAIILVVTGIEIITESIKRALHLIPLNNQESLLIIGIIIIITALVKELMAQFSFNIGKKIKSDTLSADAWHHRTDALSSIGVGTSLIASSYGYIWLDPVFGAVVSIIIIYVGSKLIKSVSNLLIGQPPDKKILKKINTITQSIPKIKEVHAVCIHDYVTHKVITLHALVDKQMTVENAHKICDDLQEKIKKELNCTAIIHIEPNKKQQKKTKISP